MAFKMKGSPMERNFPSAFKQDKTKKEKRIHTAKEIGKTLLIPGYGARKLVKHLHNKYGKKEEIMASRRNISTMQDKMDEKRKLGYDPQSQR
tara:strand:+ start:619 stop:894 length:276 start_codon:yes stop_codon:yes gene_type:complete